MERRWIESRLADIGRGKTELAAALGVAPSRVSEIISGSRTVKVTEIPPLARFLGMTWQEVFARLSDEKQLEDVTSPHIMVDVRGEVAAGTWQPSAEWPTDSWERIAVLKPDNCHEHYYALRVRGTSMDKVFAAGTLLICVHCQYYQREIADGDYAIIERQEHGEFEATCKQLQQDNEGNWWAWPRSNDPQWQQPIKLSAPCDLPDDGGTPAVRITGIVLATYNLLKP